MLDLERAPHGRRGGVVPGPVAEIERIGFGAVAFELLTGRPQLAKDARSFRAGLPEDVRHRMLPHNEPRLIADVVCSIAYENGLVASSDATQEPELGNRVRMVADGDALAVTCKSVRALLHRTAPRRYACSARIAPDSEARAALLRALSAAIVQREGGFVLHAAGVELDGRAVLFLGPSGAGKSTAAALTHGARAFAHDNVAVVPSVADRGCYLAFGLPGGRPAALPVSEQAVWPLGALVRIVREPGRTEPKLSRLGGIDALFSVRESVQMPEGAPQVGAGQVTDIETSRLSNVASCLAHVRVGALATVLGTDPGALLRELLSEPGTGGAR